MQIKIVNAKPEHKPYLLQANAEINQVNEETHISNFSKNLDNDYFCANPKFKCLVALANDFPVGMLLYSKMYWADDGEVIWVSQTHVAKEYRKYGVFFKLVNEIKKRNKNTKKISCATGKANKTMQKLLSFAGGKQMDLLFYYVKLK